MNLFASNLSETLNSLMSKIADGTLTENNNLEFKSSAVSTLEMKNELIKTVVGFLNSDEGGLLVIGAADNGTLLGLKQTEAKFSNVDNYEQNITQYIRENIIDGMERLSNCIRIKFIEYREKLICGVFVKPFFPDENQVLAFGKIWSDKRTFDDVCFVRTGNLTNKLTHLEIAKVSASRRLGNILEPDLLDSDTAGKPVAISEVSTLIKVNPDGLTPNGKSCLELTLLIGKNEVKKYRLSSFSKHSEITSKAQRLIGRQVKTITWEPKNKPPRYYENMGYFENLYVVAENQVFNVADE